MHFENDVDDHMFLFRIFSGIIERLMITDEQLEALREPPRSGSSPSNADNVLVNALKEYMDMYFDDFFQLRSFSDEQYRAILNKIISEIKKNPDLSAIQVENLKQFQSFSRSMYKAVFKLLKQEESSE